MTRDQREIHRKKRILEYAERIGNINKACRYFGVARSSFYEWRDRYREFGDEGLKSRRCCPHKHPNKTPDEVQPDRPSARHCDILAHASVLFGPHLVISPRIIGDLMILCREDDLLMSSIMCIPHRAI